MEISFKKLIIRYFSNPNYLCSLLSHSQPFTTVSLFSKTQNPSFPFAQSYANHTSKPRYSSISSTGSPSFFPITPPISQSLIPLRGSHSFDQPRFGFLRPHGQFRLLSVSSSDENNEFEKMGIVGSDESKFRVSAVGKFVPNVSPKQVSEIIEVTRSGEDDLEFKLNMMSISLSVESLSGIFRVLNCERVSALRLFVWAREANPSLYYSADVCSLIIDNCGWLEDYETMRCLLKDFSSNRICLSEKAFGFLPILGSGKASIVESITRVIELLNEVGGSCRGSGICALLKLLSKMDLFEIAKFVIELTDRKTSYYNILTLEMCRRCSFSEARDMIEEMRRCNCDPDAKTYNYMLSALCKHDRTEEACSLLEKMKEKGCPPDALTFEIFIYYSCRLGKLDAAAQFFDQMVSRGLEPRLTTHAAFVKGYFYSRQYEEAYNYAVTSSFKYKHSSNMIYSLLASLHLRKGNLITAGNILVEMMDKGFSPSFSVYMRISKRLHKTGKTQLVRDLKNRFFSIKSLPKATEN
ncbi:pentatricopeptide repeat-containing protein At5g39710-like isoform X1 [Actinidia eriantha]|uniref:pentatricopeptide repeat-containing protein At5g39710-like isoform X1 n=1 Tax=Actinidia eriantha TaxID=165200 RepID=UPI0025899052|nr:pentatricopeptide repeat-containing protein At5g39710-like isoform X1 [Actinidia eriantha]